MTGAVDDLFFDELVRLYVEGNQRFVRRDWLAAQLDEKLRQPESRFALLTATPGAGKTVFMAQLAHDRPEWLRYFIRRDQRSVLSDVSDKSLLLRIGYQLAARQPELFTQEQLRLSVTQDVGEVDEGGHVIGATVKRLTVSPFYKKVVEIEQRVRENHGDVIGLQVEDLVIEVRQLSSEDLLHLALIHPARALQRLAPTKQIVVLIDALDEIRYHRTPDHIVAWLANVPGELPPNIRFVLTSRDVDGPLDTFRNKQSSRLIHLAIAESDPLVKDDVKKFVRRLVGEPKLAQLLETVEGGAAGFTARAVDKTHGNLGYLDALARGIDRAIEETSFPDEPTAARGRRTLTALVSVGELPADLQGLYGFFLGQIKADVAQERVEQTDRTTGETYDKPVWPTVYHRLLGVLAVAMEALDLELLVRLSGIQVENAWVNHALDTLRQFLDVSMGRYRFYHATVAEFLTADNGSDLHVDALQWHGRIADHYWARRSDWSTLDNYGLAHLAAHLRDADDAERLYALLTDAWSRAKYLRSGSASSFSADIDLALDCAVEHGDLPALFKLGLSFSDVAKEVPVAALETLALLEQGQRAADYAALLPTVSERLRALYHLVPLVLKRSGPEEVQRLFKDQVLSLSGGGANSTTEEIFALVGVGEVARAHALAQAGADDAARLASAWLTVARAETASGLIPRIPETVEAELDGRIARLERPYEQASALATVVLLMLETGHFEKAGTWSEKALAAALAASWSDDAAQVLSAVVQLLNRAGKGPAQARVGDLALRLARELGTSSIRIWRQKEIVPWLLGSGRDADAFDLAEHVRNPRTWRSETFRVEDEAAQARTYAEEILSTIARTLVADLPDASQAIARMQAQLAARPALREWANETRIRALLGLNDSVGAAAGQEVADLLNELDDRFPVDDPRPASPAEDEKEIRKFLVIAVSLARAGQAQEATEVVLRTLTKVRELEMKSSTYGPLYCAPEDVAIELIARHEPNHAVEIAKAIETCPTLDSGWRVATIARALVTEGYSDLATELVERVLSPGQAADEDTIKARGRLLERIAASLAALGAIERCTRAAAAVHNDLDRFRLLTTIAEDLVARGREEAARTVVGLALETFCRSLGGALTAGDVPTPNADEPGDEVRWREIAEWDSADWLELLARARRVLVRLGADALALRVGGWMDQSSGWITSDEYRTRAQILVAEALAWSGETERAVWLATQTDLYDFEARQLILQTVAVTLALRGREEEAERVLSSIKGETEQSEARIQGAADLVAGRFRTERAIAWAERGLAVRRVADAPDKAAPTTRQALHRLVQELAEQGQILQASDVIGWIRDPAFQVEAWIRISEALQNRDQDSEAVLYARRALEAAATIAAPGDRVAALKRIVEACISRSGVPQTAALLLRRGLRIINALKDEDVRAMLLTQVAAARLLNEDPRPPAIETTQPYFSLEWTCAFAEEIDFIVVPVHDQPATAVAVVQWLTIYAGYFDAGSSFAELATNGLDVVLNTLDGLNDEMLERLIGSAQALAGTAALPDAEARADRFVRIAAGIGSRRRRANGLTALLSAFAKSGFAAHALHVAERAQPLIADADSSSNFVSHALRAVDVLLASGHSREAVRLLAIALEAAKWHKRVLFDAAGDSCDALVRLERAEDLWSLFAVVEPS